jgi:integrase
MSGEQREYTVQRFGKRFAIVWWQETEAGPKRVRRLLEARDRPTAEAEARLRWQTGDGTSWTVGRLMGGYLASIADKPSHGRRQDAWKAMRPFWENVEPELIDEQMCKDYRKTRRVADATARYELLQVSTAIKWGRVEKHIATTPTMWLPPKPERETKHLTRAEFDRFFAAVRADHARVYVMLGLHTMARPSAILDLTWDRVDFMRRRIDFRPPGRAQTVKKRVIVPMNSELLVALQAAYDARTCEFVVERGGNKVGNIKKAFQAASERSTVRATPYTLRHTGAVWAAEAGVPMAQLAQFMGHDDDRTTQKHYARYSPDFLANVAESTVRGQVVDSGPCAGEALNA